MATIDCPPANTSPALLGARLPGERFQLMNWLNGATASILRRARLILAPAITAALYFRLLQRQPRQWRAAPFMAFLFGLLLLAQAGSLPMHLGLFLVGPHAHATTEGCDKKTCCTALCYVDKDGIHHCVHEHGDSCKCSVSTDDSNLNPIFPSLAIAPGEFGILALNFNPIGRIDHLVASIRTRSPSTPTPPPK